MARGGECTFAGDCAGESRRWASSPFGAETRPQVAQVRTSDKPSSWAFSPSLMMQMKEILSLITSPLRIIGIAMAKPPYLEMGVVVSFSEIFNRPATLEGAREILSQYKREAVLLVLAKLSAALRIWFRPDYRE